MARKSLTRPMSISVFTLSLFELSLIAEEERLTVSRRSHITLSAFRLTHFGRLNRFFGENSTRCSSTCIRHHNNNFLTSLEFKFNKFSELTLWIFWTIFICRNIVVWKFTRQHYLDLIFIRNEATNLSVGKVLLRYAKASYPLFPRLGVVWLDRFGSISVILRISHASFVGSALLLVDVVARSIRAALLHKFSILAHEVLLAWDNVRRTRVALESLVDFIFS